MRKILSLHYSLHCFSALKSQPWLSIKNLLSSKSIPLVRVLSQLTECFLLIEVDRECITSLYTTHFQLLPDAWLYLSHLSSLEAEEETSR